MTDFVRSTAGLRSLALTSSEAWSNCGRLQLPFALAELTLTHQVTGTVSRFPYPEDLLASLFESSSTSLRSFHTLFTYTKSPTVLAAFPLFAPQLTTLRFHSRPSEHILSLLSLCTSLKAYQSNGLWSEHPSRESELSSLPASSIDTIIMDYHVYQSLPGFFSTLHLHAPALQKVRRLVIDVPCDEYEKQGLRRMAREAEQEIEVDWAV